MKKFYFLLLSCILSCLTFTGYSQTAAAYTFTRTTGTYTSIAGAAGTVTLNNSAGMNSDDGTSTDIPIGFTFTFCGTDYTQLSANANGWISLANTSYSGSPTYTNASGSLSSWGGVGMIMGFWRDLYGFGQNSYYQTTGAVGSQVFTIEYWNWSLYPSLGYGLNFQIKLFEGSNIIQLCYGSFTTDPGATGTIGICNSTTDYQTLPTTTSTTTNTSLNTGVDLPASGTILQWAFGCSGTPTAGTVSSSISSSCSSYNSTLTLSGESTLPGVTTQWQSSTTSPTAGFSNISGATGTTYTATMATPGATVYYNNIVTCTSTTGGGGGSATTAAATLVYNTPPTLFSGSAICSGNTVSLSSSPATGTWTSSNPGVATVSATGVVSGATGASGTSVINYTLPSGCATSAVVTVNPTPNLYTVTGGGPFCNAGPGSGVHIGLSGSTPGVSYGLYKSGTLTSSSPGTGTTLDFGVISTAGAYTVLATGATGCTRAMSGAVAVTANPLPTLYPVTQTGGSNYCASIPSPIEIGVSGSNVGASYQLLNSGVASGPSVSGTGAPVSFGFEGPGSYIVVANYTLTGCTDTMTGSGSIDTIPAPSAFTVSGNGSFCAGTAGAGVHILLSNSTGGVHYQLYNGAAPAVLMTGTGSPLDFGLLSAGGTYTAVATDPGSGCSATMSGSGIITVNPLPTPYAVTGGGNYCVGAAGEHVGLLSSGSGVNYSLVKDGVFVDSIPGTNEGIDFGQFTSVGNYTVSADNSSTHCVSAMIGSVAIVVNNPPSKYSITGGGNYCSGGTGVPIGLSNSQATAFYQLYNGTTAVGGLATGIGGAFNIGAAYTSPGTYRIVGISIANGCKDTMAGAVTVVANPSPSVYSVSGGGAYCAGGTGVPVLLSNTDSGVNYLLYYGALPLGDTVAGTEGPVGFGNFTTAGTYTVVASNAATGCKSNMGGSAAVTINPAPYVYNVTGTGSYCSNDAGRHAGLSFSDAGVTYMLYNGGALIDSVAGVGAPIDFGLQTGPATYTAVAVNATTRCSSNMFGSAAITVTASPTAHTVTGGGSICSGSSVGRHIGLNTSDGGVSYQLIKAGLPVGAAVPGVAASAIDFGVFTDAGIYTVVGSASGCSAIMAGSTAIAIQPLPTLFVMTGGGNYCPGGIGVTLGLSGSATGVTYQLFNSGSPVDTVVMGTGAPLNFGLHTANGIYTAIATDATGCTNLMGGYPAVILLPAPAPHAVTGGGSYCAGGSGNVVSLDGSDTGIRYQLNLNGTATGSPLAGYGAALSFGAHTAQGAYTVTATNDVTGCTAAMPGAASIAINPLPAAETVTGGGVYCPGGPGVAVSLEPSQAGVSYQLLRSGAATSVPAMIGTGSLLNFGMQTIAGPYTVVATNPAGCTANMPGGVTVAISATTVYTISGGGIYCQGAAASHIMLSGSGSDISYQLYNGATAAGLPVTGSGVALDLGVPSGAGTYTVIGTNTSSGCVANMAGTAVVIINPLPLTHAVTGGGAYCSGGIGVHVGVDGSDAGIMYQLYNGSAAAGSLAGTGVSVDFGLLTSAGDYSVKATNPATTCTSYMMDTVAVNVNPTPEIYPVTVANFGNYCSADSGVHISLGGSGAGVNYNLYNGSSLVSTLSGTGAALDFGLQTAAGTYTVSASGPATLCNSNMSGSAVVNVVTSPAVQTLGGGGSYCPASPGSDVLLDGSQSGISYQLYNGSVAVGSTVSGTGSVVHFGLEHVGNYTATGNNIVTVLGHTVTCATPMTGTVAVTYSPLLLPVVTVTAYPAGVKVTEIDSIKAVVSNAGPSPTYQWVLNGYPLPGAVQSTYNSTQFHNGDSLACMVTSSGPCGGLTASGHVILSLADVGVAQVTSVGNDVRLAPNPNKGVFTLKGTIGTTTDEEVTLEVTNMLGQVVYTNKVTAHAGVIDERIDLGGSLANGMYIMTLRSGTQNNAIHFVVEQ